MRAQAGFTLIELMVVVIIISLLLTAGMLALRPSESARLQQTLAQVRTWLQSSCDQAAFAGTLVAIVPSEQALKALMLRQDRWVSLESEFPRPEGVQWRWQGVRPVPEDTAPLHQRAWLCWPEGEMTPGSLTARVDGEADRLRWDDWGRFVLEVAP